jgi:predicted enzyme related to lactoylglutathione lyase
MLAWYREVLGLRVLVRVVEDGYALLEAGETRLALIARTSTAPSSTRISLAFEVPDVHHIGARLSLAGSPVSHPKRDLEGLRETNTVDPDGNRIRLFSWPSDHR